MTFTKEQVEWIVVEVIRRLGLVTSSEASNKSNGSELRLNEPVVTMQVISSRLDGVRRMIVQEKAVVTPAVRDELKQRKIELIYQ